MPCLLKELDYLYQYCKTMLAIADIMLTVNNDKYSINDEDKIEGRAKQVSKGAITSRLG